MLSVLIPLRNWNPFSLVKALADQLIASGKPYEILVSDDSDPISSLLTSKLIIGIPGVKYFSRDQPLGRSANRNFLASQAQYEFLLFIDGDAGVANENFIQNYLNRLKRNTVLCGGTLYNPEPPDNPEFLLRWKYGKWREQTDAAKRQKHPWKSFSTFNFLIPAEVFPNISFDESVTGYGHEDTVFGIRLHQAGLDVFHLDNGLIHLGLEPAVVYLDKIRESGASLHKLDARQAIPDEYAQGIALLISWKRLKRFGITPLIRTWFKLRRKSIEKRLCGPNPSLLLIDLYKLGSISSID